MSKWFRDVEAMVEKYTSNYSLVYGHNEIAVTLRRGTRTRTVHMRQTEPGNPRHRLNIERDIRRAFTELKSMEQVA